MKKPKELKWGGFILLYFIVTITGTLFGFFASHSGSYAASAKSILAIPAGLFVGAIVFGFIALIRITVHWLVNWIKDGWA